jgi:tetratricopeptide (TPR) repeat protein
MIKKYKFSEKYDFSSYFICVTGCFFILACTPSEGYYLNHAEEVRYVGSQACVKCHEDVAKDYFQTGMGRSFYRPVRSEAVEIFGPSVYDPYLDFYYRAQWRNDTLYIDEFRLSGTDTVYRRSERVDYIVGSGRQTRSYLHERDGFVYQAPITWYVVAQKWDLSPGYENGANSRFSRLIGGECMNCHNAYAERVPGSVWQFRSLPLGIDCERCHGPGQEHVRRMENDQTVDVGREIDYSIVNPAKLPQELSFDVCQQCHLSGLSVPKTEREFRPGMRLSDFREIFLVPEADPEKFGISSHAARLRKSRCFSSGKLTCTVCHDPHKPTALNPAETYRAACTKCHADCKLPPERRAGNGNLCADCHMKKGGTADIPHVRFTDHYIRIIRPEVVQSDTLSRGILPFVELLCATSDAPDAEFVARAYLMYYERNVQQPVYLEKALAGLKMPFERGKALLYAGRNAEAEQELIKAVESQPRNAEFRFYLGEARAALGNYAAAADDYAKAFALNGRLAAAAAKQADALIKAHPGNRAALLRARDLWVAAANINPHDPSLYAGLAFAEMNLKNIDAARAAVERALALEPDLAVGLENAAYIALLSGRTDLARAHFRRLIQKHPRHPGIPRLRSLIR